MKVRLQKVLAEAGIASRRKSEEVIKEGRVEVNGSVVTEMGIKVDLESDMVKVDGKMIRKTSAPTMVFALYKPKSCVTTMDDPEGRDTIKNYFPPGVKRLFPVGRLDYDAEGLILLTNDGEFANLISHPRHHVWKTYFVKVKGLITFEELKSLSRGPVLEGKKRKPMKAKLIHHIHEKSWVEVSLQEGVNRQIKKVFANLGYPVQKIKRFSVGNITLEEMNPGEYKPLAREEIDELIRLSQKG